MGIDDLEGEQARGRNHHKVGGGVFLGLLLGGDADGVAAGGEVDVVGVLPRGPAVLARRQRQVPRVLRAPVAALIVVLAAASLLLAVFGLLELAVLALLPVELALGVGPPRHLLVPVVDEAGLPGPHDRVARTHELVHQRDVLAAPPVLKGRHVVPADGLVVAREGPDHPKAPPEEVVDRLVVRVPLGPRPLLDAHLGRIDATGPALAQGQDNRLVQGQGDVHVHIAGEEDVVVAQSLPDAVVQHEGAREGGDPRRGEQVLGVYQAAPLKVRLTPGPSLFAAAPTAAAAAAVAVAAIAVVVHEHESHHVL